jgi:hypothetical protein
LRAWRVWRLLVAQHLSQKHMAEVVMGESMRRRRNHARLKRALCTWSVHVLRTLRERYGALKLRFHRAGVKGELAELQWVIGKWQQMATIVQQRRMATLEKEHFLRHIRAENAKLREMLVEYHRRGMFVLDGSKDYIVQRKIAPALTLEDYSSVDAMIQSSYHKAELAGLKIDAKAGKQGFGTRRDRGLQKRRGDVGGSSKVGSRGMRRGGGGRERTLLSSSRGPQLPQSQGLDALILQASSPPHLRALLTPPKTRQPSSKVADDLTDEEILRAIQSYNAEDIRDAMAATRRSTGAGTRRLD